MEEAQLKSRMTVQIAENIDETTRVLSSNLDMANMAGNGENYIIQGVRDHTTEKVESGICKIAEVKGYVWMPCDLYDPSISISDDEYVTVKAKKVMFDPSEL